MTDDQNTAGETLPPLTTENFDDVPVYDWFDLTRGSPHRTIASDIGRGNFCARPNELKNKGDIRGLHKHDFDHVMINCRGSIGVRWRNSLGVTRLVKLALGTGLTVKAGVEHEVIALENDSWFICNFAHRDMQGDLVTNPDNPYAYK